MLKMRGKAPRGRKHKRTQSRKMHEDGDKTKEKHGMQPQPRPTHKQAHAFFLYEGWQQEAAQGMTSMLKKKNTKAPSTPSL